MRTLLVHNSDRDELIKIKEWSDVRKEINDFAQITTKRDLTKLMKQHVNSDILQLEKKIQKAFTIQPIKKVFLFVRPPLEELTHEYLFERFSRVSFIYIINY